MLDALRRDCNQVEIMVLEVGGAFVQFAQEGEGNYTVSLDSMFDLAS